MAPHIPAPKTATITVASPIIQQPRLRETTTVREYFDDTAPAPLAPIAPVIPHQVPLPRSRAGTVTSTIGTAAPTLSAPLVSGVRQPQPHDIPLPASRAPTVISPVQAHHVPLPASRAPTVIAPGTTQAYNIPLPVSRSHAPTAYDGTPPDLLSPKTDRSHRSARSGRPQAHTQSEGTPITVPVPVVRSFDPVNVHALRTMPSISVIDYAMGQPLPESRATTMYGTPKAPTRVSLLVSHLILICHVPLTDRAR